MDTPPRSIWAPSELAKLQLTSRMIAEDRSRWTISGHFDDGWHPRDTAIRHLRAVLGLVLASNRWRTVGEPISRQLDHTPNAIRPSTHWQLVCDAEPMSDLPASGPASARHLRTAFSLFEAEPPG
jgi:hypothetical protein